jgi:hypothetical protein
MNCEIPTLSRQTNQIGERDPSLDRGHDKCVVEPCADCLFACEMNLMFIKDGTWPMVDSVKTERIAYYERLIAAGKARTSCGCERGGKKPNPNCFSAACEFCRYCGACGADNVIVVNDEKLRFCDDECEQAWTRDDANV